MEKEIMQLLLKAREKFPELRTGQTMFLAAKKVGWSGNDLFYCPDETIITGLKALLTSEEI